MGGLTAQALAVRLLSYTTVPAAAAASLLVRRGHRLAAISTDRDGAGWAERISPCPTPSTSTIFNQR